MLRFFPGAPDIAPGRRASLRPHPRYAGTPMDNARPTILSRAITEAKPNARRFCRASGVLCGLWSTAPEWPLHDAGLQPGGVPGPEASGVAGAGWRPSWGFLEASIDFDPTDTADRVRFVPRSRASIFLATSLQLHPGLVAIRELDAGRLESISDERFLLFGDGRCPTL